jgi:hypothetical protein
MPNINVLERTHVNAGKHCMNNFTTPSNNNIQNEEMPAEHRTYILEKLSEAEDWAAQPDAKWLTHEDAMRIFDGV